MFFFLFVVYFVLFYHFRPTREYIHNVMVSEWKKRIFSAVDMLSWICDNYTEINCGGELRTFDQDYKKINKVTATKNLRRIDRRERL